MSQLILSVLLKQYLSLYIFLCAIIYLGAKHSIRLQTFLRECVLPKNSLMLNTNFKNNRLKISGNKTWIYPGQV